MKIFHVQDDPKSQYSREWKWKPTIEYYNRGLNFSIELHLIKWKGEEITPRVVGLYSFRLNFNPRFWKVSQIHNYYDGPNCCWQVGPIEFLRCGFGNCNKCSLEKHTDV